MMGVSILKLFNILDFLCDYTFVKLLFILFVDFRSKFFHFLLFICSTGELINILVLESLITLSTKLLMSLSDIFCLLLSVIFGLLLSDIFGLLLSVIFGLLLYECDLYFIYSN